MTSENGSTNDSHELVSEEYVSLQEEEQQIDLQGRILNQGQFQKADTYFSTGIKLVLLLEFVYFVYSLKVLCFISVVENIWSLTSEVYFLQTDEIDKMKDILLYFRYITE